MSNKDLERFEYICRKVKRANAEIGYERFSPIHSTEKVGLNPEKEIPVYGLYDQKTKKFTLSEPFIDVNIVFDEMELLLKGRL